MQDPKKSPKIAICSTITTLSGYIFATKAPIDNRKKVLSSNMSSRCRHNVVNFGLLAAEIGLPVWAPQLISTAFASWQRYCTAVKQWASAKLCGVEQRTPPTFGRATITLGTGPHSSDSSSPKSFPSSSCRRSTLHIRLVQSTVIKYLSKSKS